MIGGATMRDYEVRPAEILLVEDNPADALLTQEAFKNSKLTKQVHVVEDGEQALAFLRKDKGYEDAVTPDLILLDLNLPKIDGREVLLEINSSSTLRQIPVVVLTSSTLEKDIMDAYGKGANSYIVKPIELEKFVKKVEAIESYWFAMSTIPPV